jgi:membrane associated rhomboid family serine protease
MSAALETENFGVGASTALYGTLSATLIMFLFNFPPWSQITSGPYLAQSAFFLFTMFFTLTGGMVGGGNLDRYGHIGGFLTGGLLAVVMSTARYRILAVLTLLAMISGLAVFLFKRSIPMCDNAIERLYCSLLCDL